MESSLACKEAAREAMVASAQGSHKNILGEMESGLLICVNMRLFNTAPNAVLVCAIMQLPGLAPEFYRDRWRFRLIYINHGRTRED